MKESDPHSSPIKSPKQLVIVVVLAFIVPIVVIVLVTQLVTGVRQGSSENDKEILSRIRAVGTVVVGEPSAPKGGSADLTDAEVARAVVYIANQAGANWKEPAAPATAQAPATSASSSPTAAPSAPAQATAAAPSAPAASAAAKPDGKKIYDTTCIACHGAGIAGAPKFGDKSAWAARIAEGNDTLYTHAIQGFQGKDGVMPPKGGNTALADADVKAAVDYMVSAAK